MPHLRKVEDGMPTWVFVDGSQISMSPPYFHLGTIYKRCSLGDRLLQNLFAFLTLTSLQLNFSLTFYSVFLPPTFKQSPLTSLGTWRKQRVTKIMENSSTEANTSRKRTELNAFTIPSFGSRRCWPPLQAAQPLPQGWESQWLILQLGDEKRKDSIYIQSYQQVLCLY